MPSLFAPDAPVQAALKLSDPPREVSFTEKYRPTTLAEVMGQDNVVRQLQAFVANPYPCALLFSGDTGAGKTSAALALAHDLKVNQAADFFHIKSGALDGEATEEIIRLLRFTPWCGWRLILVDEADQWTPKARNLWLSALESLPSRTVVVFTTNHPEKFDQRTMDRFTHFPFESNAVLTRDAAQALADDIWRAETGAEDGPTLDDLPNIIQNGMISFRRVVSALQSLVRFGLWPVAPVCGGAPAAEVEAEVEAESIPSEADETCGNAEVEIPTPEPEPTPPKPRRKRRTKEEIAAEKEAKEARALARQAKQLGPVDFAVSQGNTIASLHDLRPGDRFAQHSRDQSLNYQVRGVYEHGFTIALGLGLEHDVQPLFYSPEEASELMLDATILPRQEADDDDPTPPTDPSGEKEKSKTCGDEEADSRDAAPADTQLTPLPGFSGDPPTGVLGGDDGEGSTTTLLDVRDNDGRCAVLPSQLLLDGMLGTVHQGGMAQQAAGPTTLPLAPTTPQERRADLIDSFLAGRKPTTLRAYQGDLRHFAAWAGLSTPAHAAAWLCALSGPDANHAVLRYRAEMQESGLGAATVSRRVSMLKSLARMARLVGACSWTLEIDTPRVETYKDTAGPGAVGWRKMLEEAKADTSPRGFRDVALLRLLHDLGLRRSEALGLDLEHLEREDSRPTAVWIRGKGRDGRERLTLPDPTSAALERWLEARGPATGPLFTRLDHAVGADTRADPRLTANAVYDMVRRAGARAGLARPTAPHQLRHQAITEALDKTGGDVRAVARFSRHKSIDVVVRYDDNRQDLGGRIAALVAGE